MRVVESLAVSVKARRYLAEGRVRVLRVDGDAATVEVRGGELYRVECVRGSWVCSCPARTSRCAHVVAAELVTVPQAVAA